MFSDSDYETLRSWWSGHGWSPVPRKVLPPLGVISNNAAAGFLYMDNGGTGVAMMEWIVTDPKASPRDSVKAIREVVDFLKSEAMRMGYDIILTTCRQPSLSRLLQKAGFAETDNQMIHLLGIFA